ncbi:MAG: radical SAM protein [Myxococcota bacterium]
MANIGYIQVVRHCNHFCGFCSNPTTPYVHTFETVAALADDLAEQGYFGVILTGGEPTLHPELPRIVAYCRDLGLHVRMITNGHRLADEAFARDLGEAGLQLVHVSVYSTRPEVEERLRGLPRTLERAVAGIDHAHRHGITVNINSVINRMNADHLDESVAYWLEHHPYIPHFVWNNLDPSMGRAEVNQDRFVPRLADFEASLKRALDLLYRSGRTFRVEKVPLCYMTEYAWASTETRKIIKGEDRLIFYLDEMQAVRQAEWGHIYSEACDSCSLRSICAGLFDRGDGYDPAELYPLFVPREPVVERVLFDPHEPASGFASVAEWARWFDARRDVTAPKSATDGVLARKEEETRPPVGMITEEGLRRFEKKRRAESRRARALGVRMERAAPDGGDAPGHR